ncbi:MAG: PH domain-containing protein [Deltaproteobacteria bacterium]|nr:PH domain-containing protein [Deltaproteobacteria bacterium]
MSIRDEAAASGDVARGEELLFQGNPAVMPDLGSVFLAVLTLGLALLYLKWKSVGVHYRVTTQRIVIERGVFSKRMDQLDVYRITDYAIEQPFSQRLLGTGNLILKSMDTTNPEIRIDAVKTDIRGLYENLRRATELERQRRGVRLVDSEAHLIS